MPAPRIWVYSARVWNKSHTHHATYNRALSDEQYAIPEIRDIEEQRTVAELRGVEGVTPDTPIERLGWRPFGGEGEDGAS